MLSPLWHLAGAPGKAADNVVVVVLALRACGGYDFWDYNLRAPEVTLPPGQPPRPPLPLPIHTPGAGAVRGQKMK